MTGVHSVPAASERAGMYETNWIFDILYFDIREGIAMREVMFEKFLVNESSISSDAAVRTRMRKAQEAEDILKCSLDTVVSNDDTMFEALQLLQNHEDSVHNRLQNALRKYYKFVNNKEFPRMKSYHSAKHP